jgi:hypothetical protein
MRHQGVAKKSRLFPFATICPTSPIRVCHTGTIVCSVIFADSHTTAENTEESFSKNGCIKLNENENRN